MAKRKRNRKLRKSIKYTLYVLIILALGFLVYNFFFKNDKWDAYQSVNAEAKKATTDTCLVFYPDGFKNKEELLDKLCTKDLNEEEVEVFDYTLKEDGGYYHLAYDKGVEYYLDSSYNTPSFSGELSTKAKMMISDHLRYTMKSKGLDYAYTLRFLEESYYENIDDMEYSCDIKGADLSCYFKAYETEVKVPIKYIGNEIGINITIENYIKPTYIDPERKAIALTFDDGPSLSEGATQTIIDTLYKYDGNGTFFVLGYRLNEDANELLKDSISKGNEYGSHTMNHYDLTTLSKDTLVNEVMGVADYFKENFDYEVKMYRPPYGFYNSFVDENITLPAILWELDTNDWSSRDADSVYESVFKYLNNHMILLFHDIYDSTGSALSSKGIIERLIDEGYQLVTVSELAKIRGVELTQGTHLGW